MSTYLITGGANGIGFATVSALRNQGHEVASIDIEKGDIIADLGIPEERNKVIKIAHEMFPEGIDGLACIAGIAWPKPTNSRVLSVNYFGTIAIADGLFDLLLKKHGSCVITSSSALNWKRNIDTPDLAQLLTDCGDEERICRLVDSFPINSPYNMYQTTKIALLRWGRRHSVEWAVRGVRLNIVGPGCIDTRLSVKPADSSANDSFHKTIPTHYSEETLISPEEVAGVYTFLLSPESKGISGSVIWVDGGQESFYNTERLI